jgi:hypothetical protein
MKNCWPLKRRNPCVTQKDAHSEETKLKTKKRKKGKRYSGDGTTMEHLREQKRRKNERRLRKKSEKKYGWRESGERGEVSEKECRKK